MSPNHVYSVVFLIMIGYNKNKQFKGYRPAIERA